MSLSLALEGRRIVVVCGSGGVGKTTISAAVAQIPATSGGYSWANSSFSLAARGVNSIPASSATARVRVG